MTCLMHCHLQLNVINIQTIRLFIDTVNHLSSKIAMSLDRLTTWSSQCNLALNPKKTEVRLLSTAQLSRVHGLDTHSINLSANEKEFERVSTFRLLGTQVHQNLNWIDEINIRISSCYGILSIIRKLKHLAPFNFRKQPVSRVPHYVKVGLQ